MARRRKREHIGGHGGDHAEMPSLTSLMDVCIIILIYLIKLFVATPLEMKDPSTKLPFSNSMEPVENSIVVMITGAQRTEPGGIRGQNEDVAAIPTIVLDDEVILHLNQDFSIPDDQMDKGMIIRPLRQKLLETRKQQGVTAELIDTEGFSGKIVFLVDKHVPYDTLSKALVSSASAGYDGFKFAVIKREG